MSNLLLADESYRIVGICMEVHRNLGRGFKEIVYKDAIEFEFIRHSIEYGREIKFEIFYKGCVLPHYYYADFVVYNAVLLEVKSSSIIVNEFIIQTLNYLKASDLKLGLIANFGEASFVSRRVVF